ncbi:MAG TPA: CHAD domain-containing protein [Bryobacteraceae bacterium]|nr:CHAD domain-containing protein [Bryobacteraceae bacterium]
MREEVESATSELLEGKGRKRDEAIHEARKSIKKLRGALRLLQPELGAIYRDQNTKLSETGRQLSEIRDAEAIIEVFNGVVEKYRAQLKPEAVRAVLGGLNKNKQDTLKRLNVDAVVRKAVSGLRSTAKGVDTWPLKKDGFEALAPGLRKRYKSGRKAMTAVMRQPTPEHYHEWRKRVKDHWYHVRLLEDMWTDILKAREGALKDLETWLGDDHNLVVLREKLQADPDLYGGNENVHVFTGLMDEYSRELREKSLVLGSKVYEQKSKLLVRDMGKLWEAWQNESAVKKTVGKQSPAKTAAKTAAA